MFEFLGRVRKFRDDQRRRSVLGIIGSVKSCLIASLLLGSGAAEAKIVYVNRAVATPGKGTSWATAYRHLRDALDQSLTSDTIYVAKGTYYPDDGASARFGDREYSFDLSGQKIYGGFAGTETSLSQRNVTANPTILSGAIWDREGENAYWSLHVVVLAQSSTLDGVTVENGHASGAHSMNYPSVPFYDAGGGCYVMAGKTLTITGCVFRGNRALESGGAIMVENDSGKVVATNCLFEGNGIPLDYDVTPGLAKGGAIRGNVTATNCKFISNLVRASNFIGGTTSTAAGGAIAGNVTATNCDFTGNSILALGDESVLTKASGGAIAGNVFATKCRFISNDSKTEADIDLGISSGGAISGGTVVTVNCSFSANQNGKGKIDENDGTGLGGGGAIHVANGKSNIANCVFVGNTSEFRGGAIGSEATATTNKLVVTNCTFLNNGVTTGFGGAALSCGGYVKILSNIFWQTADQAGDFDQDNLIFVASKGALRNSDVDYPTPSTVAPNLVKGGEAVITKGSGASIFLVNTDTMIVDANPLFANLADPNGTDNAWGTADDGLRLLAGSPAIGFARDARIPLGANLLPKDLLDVDKDGDVTELLPIDIVGVVRIQNSFVEMGAYEVGSLANIPEIAVFLQSGAGLVDGGSASFGKVPKGSSVLRTFTIRNSGVNTLQNIAVLINGSRTFKLKKAPAARLKPGDSMTFIVSFKPTDKGKQTAKLLVVSDDADENPFDIILTGNGVIKKNSAKSSGFAAMGSSMFPLAASTGIPAAATITTSEASDGSKYLVLTVRKSAHRNASKLVVEVSSNLLDWYSGKNHTTTLVDSPALLSVRDNTPLNQVETRFIRLK